MKKFLIALLSLCAMATFAAPPKGWITNYDDAIKQAAEQKKHVLVLFTGSDWCGWCKKLRKDTLDQAGFKRYAKNNLILLYQDMPRKITTAERAKIMELAKKLNAGRGVPCTVILKPDGSVAGQISGYRHLKKYLSEIKKIVKK